ncbi:MAG: pentapeptide repeat-containing protein [Leptolyngbya sp.]|nr:pentapeptide repeat-containing protein [Leptolyngbya sp.]
MSLHHSDFGFSHDSDQLTPMSVKDLLAEYAEGRRQFHSLDLRESNLANAKLVMINLEESSLQRATLTGTNLAGATLNHVDFSSANLTNANLIAADLVRARLSNANLTGAVFSGANLSGANLRKADLTNCIFAGTNLSGVDFSGAILSNVILGGANLKGANLSEVDLSEIDLGDVDLTETILPVGLAGQQWMSDNRDFSANFGEAVPGWEHPTGDYIPEETANQEGDAVADDARGYYLLPGDPPVATDEAAGYAEGEYAATGYGDQSDPNYAHPSPEDEALSLNALNAMDAMALADTTEVQQPWPVADTTLPLDAAEEDRTEILAESSPFSSPFAPEASAAFSATPEDRDQIFDPDPSWIEAPLSSPTAADPEATLSAPLDPVSSVNPWVAPSLDRAAADDLQDANGGNFFTDVPHDALTSNEGTVGFDAGGIDDDGEENTQFQGSFDPGASIDQGFEAHSDTPSDPVFSEESWGSLPTEGADSPTLDMALNPETPPINAFQTQDALGDDITAEDLTVTGLTSEALPSIDSTPTAFTPEPDPALPRDDAPGPDETDLDPAVTAEPHRAATPPSSRPRATSTPLSSAAPTKSTIPAVNTRMVQSIQAALGRRVNYTLQRRLLDLYHNRCAITGCDIQPLLETVFVTNHDRERADHPSQCLVLRADLRTLYELKLLAIHPTTREVLLAPQLLNSDYGPLQGRRIAIPEQKIYHPSPGGLAQNLQDCLWYDASYAASQPLGGSPPMMSGVQDGGETSTNQAPWPLLPMLIACGLGGFILGGLGFGVVRHVLMANSEAHSSTPPPAQVSPADSNRIHVQVGDVRYNRQGVLIDQKAYLSLEQAQQWGVVSGEVPGEYQRQYQGQPYVSLSYLVATGTPVEWKAQSRTAILDCCQSKSVETINLRIQGRNWPSAGIIVDNRSYVPQRRLDPLNLDSSRLNPDHTIDYRGNTYLRSGDLKDLAVVVNWDAETRTLIIEN